MSVSYGADIAALRDAAISGQASEALVQSTWEAVATWVVDRNAMSLDTMKEIATEMETRFKAEYSLAIMPPAYRSAKSVAFGAKKHGISLTDSNGKLVTRRTVEESLRHTREVAKAVAGGGGKVTKEAATIETLVDTLIALYSQGHRPYNKEDTAFKLTNLVALTKE